MRRAMTCVYWEPKSRMTICSFIGNEGEVSARLRGILREKNWSGCWSVVGCQLYVVNCHPTDMRHASPRHERCRTDESRLWRLGFLCADDLGLWPRLV